MRIFRRPDFGELEPLVSGVLPSATPEQLEELGRHLPSLMEQLRANKVVAEAEFAEAQLEHCRAWFRSFGLEVEF